MTRSLSRHLLWDQASSALSDADAAARETFSLDVYKVPREQAVYLLKVVAEVEHALMVQYLFAAWSLGGEHVSDAGHIQAIRCWRAKILDIAREEMAHLVTLENLLTLIGGTLSLAREDYPAQTDLYPFEFELEPLTKASLAKYLLAEMPSDSILADLKLTSKIEGIRKSLPSGVARRVHRVGVLYDELIHLFTAPTGFLGQSKPFIPTADIQADSARFMVQPGEWSLGYRDLLISAPAARGDAITALQNISSQGEGHDLNNLDNSHFGRFLAIYDAFPEPGDWIPSRPLAKNPSIDPKNTGASQIRHKAAWKWARLFNLRYRMLLLFLAHSFAIEAPSDQAVRTSRGLLISWTFGEMYHLRSIAGILMALPIEAESDKRAGPPFEMPLTLDLPAREADRWRLHRDLISASQYYAGELLQLEASDNVKTYLRGFETANASALQQCIALVGA